MLDPNYIEDAKQVKVDAKLQERILFNKRLGFRKRTTATHSDFVASRDVCCRRKVLFKSKLMPLHNI